MAAGISTLQKKRLFAGGADIVSVEKESKGVRLNDIFADSAMSFSDPEAVSSVYPVFLDSGILGIYLLDTGFNLCYPIQDYEKVNIIRKTLYK